MIHFDQSQIYNWADLPNANHQLPELLRRLILATAPELSRLSMPSGSAVWLSGWDGLLTAEVGNAWVPKGNSAWEFSCRKDIGTKANDDYRKRTDPPDGVPDTTTTFMFVTPRQWNQNQKEEWEKQRRDEGKWANVRAIDASDLVAWLSQAPAVAQWFAPLIGKLPADGFATLDGWWENWTASSQPNIIPALVLAGRQDSAERLTQWFQQTATSYYVQGQTRDEAIAFVAASAMDTDDAWGSALLRKTLVVQSEAAWNGLIGHTSPLVLIRAFEGDVSSQVAISRGHHVITPLYANEDPKGNGDTLKRLGSDEMVAALIEMGLSEARARELARQTARSLIITRRSLIDEAGGPPPAWASLDPHSPLPPLMLIGQWDESNENDKEVIARITGRQYEEVAREIAVLVLNEDSPLTKTGNRWRFLSHEEAWYLLAPRLTQAEADRFMEVAVQVLGTESTAYELPIEERRMAGIRGKGVPHSDLLREGISQTLALIGTQGERARNVRDASYVPGVVLRSVFTNNARWQIWATLTREMSILAEAAPEAVLEAVERCLSTTPSPFEDLFHQEGDVLFGGAHHTGLLWALEKLSWSPDYFARTANALSRLSQIDPGGRAGNRPAESLADLFLPWFRLSEAPDEERLETLEGLLQRAPSSGWETLINAYPSSMSVGVTDRKPPSWRPWGRDGARQPNWAEIDNFVEGMEHLLTGYVGSDATRWNGAIGIIQNLTPNTRQRMLTLLKQRTDEIRMHPGAGELWETLRKKLNQHRSHPDAQWAMPAADLDALEAVYQRLAPHDPTTAHAWLFDWHPDLLEGNSYEIADDENKARKARQSAIAIAHEYGGIKAVLSMARLAAVPEMVGWAFADSVGTNPALMIVIEHLGSENENFQKMAYGTLWELFRQSGWAILEDVISNLKATGSGPKEVGRAYLVAPPGRDTWERVAAEAPETQRCYWEQMDPRMASHDEDVGYIAEKLLEVHRAPTVAAWTAHEAVHHEIVIQTLAQLPFDLSAEADQFRDANMVVHSIVRLLEKLDESEAVSDEIIAHLEMPFVRALWHGERSNLAIYRAIAKDPSLFAELIASGHQRRDGQANAEPREVTTEILVQIIFGQGEIPGKLDDGTVDYEALSAWIKEARRLCAERGNGKIADDYIGRLLAKAPAGKDGIRPCEPVRELLDEICSPDIGAGFVMANSNFSGAVSARLFYETSESYLTESSAIRSKWPFTARLLREISERFQQMGEREDREANERDQFEF